MRFPTFAYRCISQTYRQDLVSGSPFVKLQTLLAQGHYQSWGTRLEGGGGGLNS